MNIHYRACAYCGKLHPKNDAPDGGRMWCNDACHKAHEAADPSISEGWIPIEQTLPGGRYDGIWENSGMTLRSGDAES